MFIRKKTSSEIDQILNQKNEEEKAIEEEDKEDKKKSKKKKKKKKGKEAHNEDEIFDPFDSPDKTV